MIRRAAKFYFGVWLPLATAWVAVVLVAAALMRDSDIKVGLGAAVFGPVIALLLAASYSRDDKKNSLGFIAAHAELSDAELMKRGLKKGLILAPVSVVGVAAFFALPFVIDRILTAFGR